MSAIRNIPVDALREVLADHYPTVICNHEARTDRAQCSCCGYEPRICRSVGEAVRTWIDHVIAELEGRAAAESEAKACPGFIQGSGETYVTRTPCILPVDHGGPCRFEPEAKDEPCANAECPVGCPESHCFTRCPTCETSTVGPDGCCTVCDWGCANEVRP